MIGDDIVEALPELRAQAVSLMQDHCTIAMPDPDGVPAWNPATEVYDPPAPLTLYSGVCRVRQPNQGDSTGEAGEATFNISERIVSIPMAGAGYTPACLALGGIPVKATVAIDAIGPVTDPFELGRRYSYESPASQQTHATARRMRCKEVD